MESKQQYRVERLDRQHGWKLQCGPYSTLGEAVSHAGRHSCDKPDTHFRAMDGEKESALFCGGRVVWDEEIKEAIRGEGESNRRRTYCVQQDNMGRWAAISPYTPLSLAMARAGELSVEEPGSRIRVLRSDLTEEARFFNGKLEWTREMQEVQRG